MPGSAANSARPAPTVAWYTVMLCMVAYVLAFVDRQIIALLIEPIQADLEISDTQFSLLTGFAFALFYAIMGLPIARWADTGPRPLIISAGIVIWSFATAACGIARTFVQLFFARMAVGVGEAALSPTAYSIITDSFPKSRLGLALGVYSIGAFLGSGLAFIVGGAVIDIVGRMGVIDLPLLGVIKPWQTAFFIVGIPGVLVGILFLLTVRDPARTGLATDEKGADQAFTIRKVMDYIGGHKPTFTAHYLGFGLLALSMYALLSWAPAYLMRVYELSARDAGLYLGTIVLIANTAGTLTSGWLADFFTRRGHDDAPLRAGIIGGLGVIIPAALFSSMPDLTSSLLVLAVAFFFASFPVATSAAGLQLMAPNQMRAQVTALFFLAMNLFGITGGATLVAVLTDYVFGDILKVGYSMSVACALSGICGAATLAWGLRHFSATARKVAQLAPTKV
ncbi:MAG: MFS transporter [Gammaproteobacteria bacterium]|nr:MFS transporter [Gammaproteobacteria bacterium]